MADNHRLVTEFDADVSGLVDGIKKAESTASDLEKEIIDAFGGMEGVLDGLGDSIKIAGDILGKSFSEGVSSISEAEDSVGKLNKELGNMQIDGSGLDGMNSGLEDTVSTVEVLYNDLKNLGTINLKFDTFKDLVDSIEEAGIDVDVLGEHLKSLEGVTIDGSMLTRLGKEVNAAEGDVDRFKSALKSINSSDVKSVGSDFNKTGSDAKGAGGDVDRFDSALKGVGSGSGLKDVQGDIEGIVDEADNAVGALEGMAGAIGGMVGLGSLEESIQLGVEVSKLNFDLEGALNAGLKDGQRINVDVAMDLVGDEYATLSSIMGEDEATELIRTISVHADTDDATEVVRLVGEVGNLASNTAIKFNVDATEVYEEAVKLSKSLDITQQEAIALQDHLLSVGLPPGEIDIISEYGQQLHRAGFSAEEIQSIMASGLNTGTWNIDILMDGLKEGRILMAEFGQGLDDATTDLANKAGISSDQMVEWGKAVASGGEEGSSALMEATKALSKIEDATLQNELGVKMFGTMWEEVGTDITDTMGNAENHAVSLADGVSRVTDETENLEDEPWVRIDAAMSTIKRTVGDLLAPIVEMVAQVATWASENETLVKVIMVVMSLLTAVITVLGVLAGVLGLVAIASMTAFGLPLIVISLIIVAIGALIAAVVLFWDEIVAVATWAYEGLKVLIGAFVEWFKGAWSVLIEWFLGLWEGIKGFFVAYVEFYSGIWTAIGEFFMGIWNTLVEWFLILWEGVKSYFLSYIVFYSTLWTTIISFFKGVWETTIEWFKNKWNSVKDTFNNLKAFMADIWETIKNTVQEKVGSLVDRAVELFTSLYSAVEEKVSNIKTAVDGAIQGAYDTVTGWFGKFKEAGGNIIGNVIEGIKGMFGSLKDVASAAFQNVRDMLPFSPPKDKSSPLAGIENNGIITQIIKGIRGQESALDSAMNGLLSGYDTTASLGMDTSVLDNDFSHVGRDLETVVNGNVESMVNVRTRDNEVKKEKQPAYINVRLGRQELEYFVDDIEEVSDRRGRRKR